MAKKTKLPKPPSPEQLNGDHDRGFEVYKMLWNMQGRIGRMEAAYVLLQATVIALIVKEFGPF